MEGRRRPFGRHAHRWLRPRADLVAKTQLPSTQSLRDLAEAAALPVFQTADINSAVSYREIASLKPDIFVCVGFDRLFSSELLSIATFGGVNAHPSPLPRLRGPSPIFWLLKEGATTIPVVLHWLSAGEDSGAILDRREAPFEPMSTGDVIYQCAGLEAGKGLSELLPRLASGLVEGEPQVGELGPRARRPSVEDARILDPEKWPCRKLAGFVVGASYFQHISVAVGGDVRAVTGVVSVEPGRVLPGDYVEAEGKLWLACGDGVVEMSTK